MFRWQVLTKSTPRRRCRRSFVILGRPYSLHPLSSFHAIGFNNIAPHDLASQSPDYQNKITLTFQNEGTQGRILPPHVLMNGTTHPVNLSTIQLTPLPQIEWVGHYNISVLNIRCRTFFFPLRTDYYSNRVPLYNLFAKLSPSAFEIAVHFLLCFEYRFRSMLLSIHSAMRAHSAGILR